MCIMTRKKRVCTKWTLVLFLVVLCQFVQSRPQDVSSSPVNKPATIVQSTENPTRATSQRTTENDKKEVPVNMTTSNTTSSRDVKTKGSGIGDSIKMVASQLLETPSNTTGSTPIVADTRIPPKLKNHLAQKHKVKTRNENGDEAAENGHVGVAVPVTMEELESENKVSEVSNESSTSNEGISTWILLSNPDRINVTSSTEPTKVEDETVKKPKPVPNKNKTKRPQVNKPSIAKRPLIGSTNKSDLVAGGSAINENVYNKIKDTVLSNVQKNKITSTHRTTSPTTTVASTTEPSTTKKEIITKSTSALPVSVTSKPSKKKNKNKHKVSTTTEAPVVNESALLPMEPKEQEIELEISTPATTTKKPKRTSSKKKKTKKRKNSKPKPETEAISIKTSNKTKSSKPSKKPSTDVSGVTTQIYNYFSREVMPSVGVGVIGLASLVGLASYFLYPFSTPVRRTFEVDKKDDLYKHNAEEYANDGNGQAEEEMLGTVLAGMPAHSKHKLNPYAGQTTHVNRNPYPTKKDQDLRYRHVSTSSYEPNYNVRYPQQKTGIAHGAVYSEPVNYNQQYPQHQPQYETRHVYTTESKYAYDKGAASYTPSYPAVEPIYAAPQTGPSGISSYGSDSSNAVVYGVKPSSDSDFKPVYPFEGQYYGEHQTTSSPMSYPSTSMYLGSNNDAEQQDNDKYDEETEDENSSPDNKFVVGNVPKELSDSETPAVVPEHGPRNLNRKKRSPLNQKRSITGSIEEILKAAKENNKDVFLSNEIDEALGATIKNLPVDTTTASTTNDNKAVELKEVSPSHASVVVTAIDDAVTTALPVTTENIAFVESVSTQPINGIKKEETTGTDMSNDLEVTTKAFRVYEVFSSSPVSVTEEKNVNEDAKETTTVKSAVTETTTDLKSEITSTVVPAIETKAPLSSTPRPRPTIFPDVPEVITYPPLNQEGSIFTFLKRLIEFKYRLGLSLIQNTSASLNRYLRSMESTVNNVAKASKV